MRTEALVTDGNSLGLHWKLERFGGARMGHKLRTGYG